MEFWGVEVPSGKPLTCEPGPASYVHVSQAALGDNKNAKGSDRVVLKVKVGTNEVVVGTLSQGKCDQTTLDLIFEKDFVLSHNSSGSVYFCGYKTDAVRDDDSMSSGSEDDEFDMGSDEEEDEEDEEAELPAKENGKIVTKPVKAAVPAVKPAAKTPVPKPEIPAVDAKSKVKPALAEKGKGAKKKISKDDEDEDSDEDDEMMGSGSDDEDFDSDEDEIDDDESEEEEVVKSAGKKRPAPAVQAVKAVKKGKSDTPGKAEPKTPSVPASTPKQQQSSKKEQSAKKTPGKENSNTPVSGKKLGQFFCQPCSKNFNSESALTQHQTAKHKS